jgi:hypothetical protein
MKKTVVILVAIAFFTGSCGQATNKNVNNMTHNAADTQNLEMLTEAEKQTILHDPEIKILGKENCLKSDSLFKIGDNTMCVKIFFEDGAYQINAHQLYDDFGIYSETLYNKEDKMLLRRRARQLEKHTYDENGALIQQEIFFLSKEGEVAFKDFDFLYDNQERLILRVEYYFGVEKSRDEYVYTDKGEKIVTYYYNYDDKGTPEYKEIVTYKDDKIISSKDFIPVK